MILYTGPGGAGSWVRRLKIGATVTIGQIGCGDQRGSAPKGEIIDPATVNDYSGGLGVVTGYWRPLSSSSLTITATQGSGDDTADRVVEVEAARGTSTMYRGKISGGTAAATAINTVAVNGLYLVTTGASAGGIVITDANVGTSEFVKGEMVALVGANRGQVRIITSHSDNTSETVTNPFDYAIAVGDVFLRCFGGNEQGWELTTDFEEFNGKMGAAVDYPDTGHAVGWWMEYDVTTPTSPQAFAVFSLVDTCGNPVA